METLYSINLRQYNKSKTGICLCCDEIFLYFDFDFIFLTISFMSYLYDCSNRDFPEPYSEPCQKSKMEGFPSSSNNKNNASQFRENIKLTNIKI